MEFVTFLLALIIAFVTYQQWLTNRNNLRVTLFAKRFAEYEAVMSFVATILVDGKLESGDEKAFDRQTKAIQFVFAGDEKIMGLKESIYKAAVNLHAAQSSNDRSKEGQCKTELHQLSVKFEEACKPYLNLKN